jgi:carbohydrate-binding DOMON domain-containing protein
MKGLGASCPGVMIRAGDLRSALGAEVVMESAPVTPTVTRTVTPTVTRTVTPTVMKRMRTRGALQTVAPRAALVRRLPRLTALAQAENRASGACRRRLGSNRFLAGP